VLASDGLRSRCVCSRWPPTLWRRRPVTAAELLPGPSRIRWRRRRREGLRIGSRADDCPLCRVGRRRRLQVFCAPPESMPPAEADFQRFFRVTTPVVHQMIETLKAHGFVDREPGKARSITFRVTPSVVAELGVTSHICETMPLIMPARSKAGWRQRTDCLEDLTGDGASAVLRELPSSHPEPEETDRILQRNPARALSCGAPWRRAA
jgi:hypothetical protein